jgi:hypothetical protein
MVRRAKLDLMPAQVGEILLEVRPVPATQYRARTLSGGRRRVIGIEILPRRR